MKVIFKLIYPNPKNNQYKSFTVDVKKNHFNKQFYHEAPPTCTVKFDRLKILFPMDLIFIGFLLCAAFHYFTWNKNTKGAVWPTC